MSGRPYTSDEVAQLKRRYAHEDTAAIAKDFGRSKSSVYQKADKLGLKKSPEYMRQLRKLEAERLTEAGKSSRWVSGHETWNKGKHHAPPGSRATQFKNGRMPEHYRPVGSERVNSEGVLERKVADPKTWRSVHVLVWEEHNGPVPDDHIVAFSNGDRSDIRIENLVCISRADNMRRNTIHRYPSELVGVIRQLSWLDRKIEGMSHEK